MRQRGSFALPGECRHIFSAPAPRSKNDGRKHALEHFAADEMGLVAPLVVNASEPARMHLGGRSVWLGRLDESWSRARRKERATWPAPAQSAGFYRLEMLARLGGYSSAVGDELADLDLALRAAAAGWRIASEQRSRVLGRPLSPPTREFRSGRCAEHFFGGICLIVAPRSRLRATRVRNRGRAPLRRSSAGELVALRGSSGRIVARARYVPTFRMWRFKTKP